MSEPVKVITREFRPATDSGMIFSTWRNSAYYGTSPPPRESGADFFRNLTKRINELLWDATVRIACLQDDHNIIIGYSVCTGDHLEWVYVKPAYRECGIAKELVPSTVLTYTKQETKIGHAILANRKAKEN